MNMRETAWRVSAAELNASTLEIRATEEKMPSYVVTPLGAKVNRVLISGVLTEIDNIGTDEEPMWRGKIVDLSGSFYINVGRFQTDAVAEMTTLKEPCFVAAVGRVKTYTGDNGRMYVSVRPEHIVEVDEKTRNEWLLETAKSTWGRLNDMKKALSDPSMKVDGLVKAGVNPAQAEGIVYALENSEELPDSMKYLGVIQGALKHLLPDRSIDLGIPEEMSDEPDEIEMDGPAGGSNGADIEDTILNLIRELDVDGRGAPREELERRAEAEGISGLELEEVSNILMDKGLIYEPNLRYLKLID